MDPAELIDAAAPETVVIGSLPPDGRDLDLLVRRAAAGVLARTLASSGFHNSGRIWVRFAGCGAEVVELIPAESFGLAPAELERLFSDAEPIGGLSSLRRPAAHHRLLILARKQSPGLRLSSKHRAAARAEGEAAWRMAQELASAWGAQAALETLATAVRVDRNPARRRWSSLARIRARRNGAVIALSGVDGAGKSTQAEGLERALTTLGYPAVIVWTSLAGHRALALVGSPVRRLLGAEHRGFGPGIERPPAGEDADRLTRLRERMPWISVIWLSFVTAVNAWAQARAVWPHLLRGRVVICDRYTLDSLVQLRYRYGEQRRYRVQLALIRLLSPRPLRAYLLDLSPREALARNQEFTAAQIEQRARLYREGCVRLGATLLDAERSREQLCAEIALDVWLALS